LVPAFAEDLAQILDLPFRPVVQKILDNDAQKKQQNSFFQCRNLDGAFKIMLPVPEGPVILIDDVVDSGWTLTVVSALLKKSGSGSVFPFALTTSGPGA
jgi:ATP-dependent DNA helicase RecQ